jgi:hypothetical protein
LCSPQVVNSFRLIRRCADHLSRRRLAWCTYAERKKPRASGAVNLVWAARLQRSLPPFRRRAARPQSHAFPHIFNTASLAGDEAYIMRLLCADLERRKGRLRYGGTFLRHSSGKCKSHGKHRGDCKHRNSHDPLPLSAPHERVQSSLLLCATVTSRGCKKPAPVSAGKARTTTRNVRIFGPVRRLMLSEAAAGAT